MVRVRRRGPSAHLPFPSVGCTLDLQTGGSSPGLLKGQFAIALWPQMGEHETIHAAVRCDSRCVARAQVTPPRLVRVLHGGLTNKEVLSHGDSVAVTLGPGVCGVCEGGVTVFDANAERDRWMLHAREGHACVSELHLARLVYGHEREALGDSVVEIDEPVDGLLWRPEWNLGRGSVDITVLAGVEELP